MGEPLTEIDLTAMKQIQPFTDNKQHHLSFSLLQIKDTEFVFTKPVREIIQMLGKISKNRIDITCVCKNHCVIGIGDNLTMMEGTVHIIKEDEKKKRPQNATLRNSVVNRIWFRIRCHTKKIQEKFLSWQHPLVTMYKYKNIGVYRNQCDTSYQGLPT